MKKEPHYVLKPDDAAEMYWREIVEPNLDSFIGALGKLDPKDIVSVLKQAWKFGFQDALSAVDRKVIVPVSNN